MSRVSGLSLPIGQTVAEVSEKYLISLLTSLTQPQTGSVDTMLVVANGDDAAVLAHQGEVVVSTDSLVENVHFRTDFSTAYQIGQKAVIQSAADIFAMGGQCTAIVLAVGFPRNTLVQWLIDFSLGAQAAAAALGATVVGGDLVRATEIVITATAMGTMEGRAPVRISGMLPGDELAVSGPLGAAAAGLVVLLKGYGETGNSLLTTVLAAQRTPSPQLLQGIVAAQVPAHAMTDISDGLISEVGNCVQRAMMPLAVEILPHAIPHFPELPQIAELCAVDIREWTVGGGEDHELLAAFAPGTVPPGWTTIGHARAASKPAVTVRDYPNPPRGWDSFAVPC